MMKKIYYKLTCIILTLFSFIIFLNFNSINSKAATNKVSYNNGILVNSKAEIKILHKNQITYSGWANRKQLLIYYQFTNKSNKQLAPNDIWTNYIVGTQNGHKLNTGALITNAGDSENAIDNSTTPISHNKTVTAAAMYQFYPNRGPITIHIYKHKHGKQIGKFIINIQ